MIASRNMSRARSRSACSRKTCRAGLKPYSAAGLSIAMGLQNATARRLVVPDLTTTVLTLTLTGFAADSTLAGGTGPRPGRRMVATGAMFVGAAIGALLLLRLGTAAVLALALVLLLIVLAGAAPHWRTTDAWTAAA
jgi:uncharacterized membrane protein YoaK (UPF0700 family)